jgi:ACS family hexuronate transporter-like MFS transporter
LRKCVRRFIFPSRRTIGEQSQTAYRAIHRLRWWIGGLLLASTVINYIDRQTLSLLAPFLKLQYHWTNTDYAAIVIAFRISYSLGQSACGRLMDRIGSRRGLTLTVAWYSLVSMLTSLASGFWSFAGLRFLLGAGESGNWPAATKVVAEWFPRQERALATALFDSGSSLGGAIAPFVVLGIYFRWGWRPAVMVPGVLGFFWLFFWRRFYQPLDTHPRLSAEERQFITAASTDASFPLEQTAKTPWLGLLKLRQTWAIVASKAFTDPVWYFVTDWFPIYLVAKGINLRSSLLAIWIPFLATDAGNFFSGWLSGVLIKRGWSVAAARKAFIVGGGIGVLLLIPTIFTANVYLITALFALSTFSYGCFTTIANVLPADMFENASVASVSGISNTAAGLCTIVAFLLVGVVSDARRATLVHSFDPILIAAGLLPFIGMIVVLILMRERRLASQVHSI